MKLRSAHIALLMGTLLLAVGCSKDPINNDVGSAFEFPSHFPLPEYNNPKNSINEERIKLGQMLFFDPILSYDSTISCASCHFQEYAFSDRERALSTGVDGKIGTRNSPALFNLAWNTSFMWDGGNNHIEVMPLAPIESEVEMNETINNIIDRLNARSDYRSLFKEAYDVDEVSDQKFLYALAQFMSSMVSANSKYDQMIKGEAQFNATEQSGYQLYQNHCASCHTEPLMTNYSFANNGLDTVFNDPGRMRITLRVEDDAKFKVPPLRNLSYSAPYMHDGRFSSLEEVIAHYTENIHLNSTGLAEELQNGISLSETEKEDLLAFLRTLDDDEFISNTRFKNPFE